MLRYFHAGEEEFRTEFKVPPFQDCSLSFLGFSEEEKANMEERTLKHGQCRSTQGSVTVPLQQLFCVCGCVFLVVVPVVNYLAGHANMKGFRTDSNTIYSTYTLLFLVLET